MDLRPGHKKEEGIEVNLTPLIDVVFLLLIFFMVSSTFDRHAKLKVQLPQADAQAQQKSIILWFYPLIQKVNIILIIDKWSMSSLKHLKKL